MEAHSSFVDGGLANVTLDIGKLILSVSVDGGRDWGSGGVGKSEVLIVVLISRPYRYRRGGCVGQGRRLIRRRGRQTSWTAHRRRLYKIIQVHGIGRGLGQLHLGLLVDRASQLRNAARSALERRPRGSRHWRGIHLAALGLSTGSRGTVSTGDRRRTRLRLCRPLLMAASVPFIAIALGSAHAHGHHPPR